MSGPLHHQSINIARVVFALLAIHAPANSAEAEPPRPVAVHYAPSENLEQVDAALIRSARSTIDLAGYVVTSWVIADELTKAAQRGVTLRIVLDPSQRHALDQLAPVLPFIRMKKGGPLMHLKSYAIDGTTLRTGSANFTPSGLKRQDNDLIVIRDAAAVAAFETQFVQIWQAAEEPHPAKGKAPEGAH